MMRLLSLLILVCVLPLTAIAALWETLEDDFNDNSLDSGKWYDWGGAQTNETNQRFEISNPASDTSYYGVDTFVQGYDLTGSFVMVEVVDAGNQSLSSWECYPMEIYNSTDNTDKMAWQITGGTANTYYVVNNSYTFGSGVSYSAGTTDWFRIRESSGTIYWEYSADGISWSVADSVSTPAGIDITDMYGDMLVGTWQSEASATYCYLDNFNIEQFAPVDVATTSALKINNGTVRANSDGTWIINN